MAAMPTIVDEGLELEEQAQDSSIDGLQSRHKTQVLMVGRAGTRLKY